MIKEYVYIKFLIKPTRITFELWGLVSASNRNMEEDIYPLVFVLTEVGCSLMSSAARVWAGWVCGEGGVGQVLAATENPQSKSGACSLICPITITHTHTHLLTSK